MRQVLKFINDKYMNAEENLNMLCKDKDMTIISIQVISQNLIYAIVDNGNEIKLSEENKKLIEKIEDLKKNCLEWHYMEKDPTYFPTPQVPVLVVYKNKCDGYIWEPTIGMIGKDKKWYGMSSFDNNYNFVIKWAYIPK